MKTLIGIAAGISLGLLALAVGCTDTYGADCIGADGYNWCMPGSWSGTEIHSPTVTPWDFSSDW